MKCINCGEPIEFGSWTREWYHVNLVDYDCNGTFCADDFDKQAEPE